MSDLEKLEFAIDKTIEETGNFNLSEYLRTGNILLFVPSIRDIMNDINFDLLKVDVIIKLLNNAIKVLKNNNSKTSNYIINLLIRYGDSRVNNNGFPGDEALEKEISVIFGERFMDQYSSNAFLGNYIEETGNYSNIEEILEYLQYEVEALKVKKDEFFGLNK